MPSERSGGHAPHDVVFVPGGGLPAAVQYAPLLAALGSSVRPVLSDLYLYSHADTDSYQIDLELDHLSAAAVAAGLTQFHLVGYSAPIPVAFVARYPDRVKSLVMIEPGMVGGGRLAPRDMVEAHRKRAQLPPEQQFPAMLASMLAPGIPPPLQEPPPPQVRDRMAVGRALVPALMAYEFDEAALSRYTRPVLVAAGNYDHPSLLGIAMELSTLFPAARLEVYEGRFHLDPVHRAEPDRFAQDLLGFWMQSEG